MAQLEGLRGFRVWGTFGFRWSKKNAKREAEVEARLPGRLDEIDNKVVLTPKKSPLSSAFFEAIISSQKEQNTV